MGLFSRKKKEIIICSPVDGEIIPISEVDDATFAEEMLGKSVAIYPSDGHFYSPIKGKVTMIFDTLHAIGLESETGEEILIHIGLDTVSLKGEPYQCLVSEGEEIDIGDLLTTVDLDLIKSKGLSPITVVILCNSDLYQDFTISDHPLTKHDEEIFTFTKK